MMCTWVLLEGILLVCMPVWWMSVERGLVLRSSSREGAMTTRGATSDDDRGEVTCKVAAYVAICACPLLIHSLLGSS